MGSQALWGLGNIIGNVYLIFIFGDFTSSLGDSAECRDYVISHGVIRPLLSRITADIPVW